ncbi:MAG TPA: DUF3710 domain-containing protein [Nocardioidaceae bacterium]|nr:DUF3710 domain-containing protein [Nocardioidaceae bacterium]
MKFRRSRSEEPEPVDEPEEESRAATEGPDGDADPRVHGPWDEAEVDLDEENPNRVDLGGMLVVGRPGLDLHLQVDESTSQVVGVTLAGADSALELRPFAAPRNGEVWSALRRTMAAEVTRQGGTATEIEGEFGTELKIALAVQLPTGQSGTQPSRVLGIAGPRWMLRATFFGKAALEPNPADEVELALRDVVVVRGGEAIPPGDPLPLRVPPNAQRVDPS